MVNIGDTTKTLVDRLNDLSVERVREIIVKYGTADARLSLKILQVELDSLGDQVIIVVE